MTLHQQKKLVESTVVCVMGVIFATRVDRGGHLHQKGLIFERRGWVENLILQILYGRFLNFIFTKQIRVPGLLVLAGNVWCGPHASTVVHSPL
jgi:hypothetical protein